MVCHPEYYKTGQDQTVQALEHLLFPLTTQSVVVHFDGFHVSIYFATFPAQHLKIIRDIDVNALQRQKEKIMLNHTRRYNLFNSVDRTDFIKEFIALVRFVAGGEANIGFLGKNRPEIHRTDKNKGDKQILHPPQEEMDENEEEIWRMAHAMNYTS